MDSENSKYLITCNSCQTDWYHFCPLCKVQIPKENVVPFLTKKGKKEVVRNLQPFRGRFVDGYDKIVPQNQSVVKKIKSDHPNYSAHKEIPAQPTPITIDNFFIATHGIFKEIDLLPDGVEKFFQSKGSAYFTNEEKSIIIRMSDHWGYNIRYCKWHLEGYDRINAFMWHRRYGKQPKIGIINISDFKVAEHNTTKKELEARHPIL